jgi:DNA mismatch repair protein MutS
MMAKTDGIPGDIAETPLMKQYYTIKAKYPDALLLFRVGDFYETFGEDAVKTAGILGIVLTKRANGAAAFVELAGFPHHSLDTYLPKLVRAGYRVAICDQLEDPKMTKTIVKRGVTELVTPGVALNDKILDSQTNNYVAGLYITKQCTGIALLDISTADFFVAQGQPEYIEKLLQGMQPGEIVIPRQQKKEFADRYGSAFCISTLDEWAFTADFASDILLGHFQTTSLKGFGIEEMAYASIAAGAVLQYLKETEHHQTKHISSISRLDENQHLWLDRFTAT